MSTKTRKYLVPEWTREQTIYVCDTCGKELLDKSYGAMKNCAMCDNDVCYSCAIITDLDHLENGSFSGDYPDYYCPVCWKEGEETRQKIIEARNLADRLWEEWKERRYHETKTRDTRSN